MYMRVTHGGSLWWPKLELQLLVAQIGLITLITQLVILASRMVLPIPGSAEYY